MIDNGFSKLQPHDLEVEKSVLGMILIDKSAFDEVGSILREEMFYTDGHQKIFKAIKSLSEKHQPIDINSVTNELKISGDLDVAGGSYYVAGTTNSVVSAAHVRNHSRIVFEKWMLREVIRINMDTLSRAYSEGDPFEIISSAQDGMSKVTDSIPQSEMTPISKVIVDTLKLINDWKVAYENDNNGGITGIPSGFREIDGCTRGWQPGDLIYIGARPSVGKTAFALNVARNAAKYLHGRKSGSVAIWSLEMKSTRLMLRILAAEAQEYLTSMQRGQLTDSQFKKLFEKSGKELANLPVFFDDTSGLTIQKLKSKARKLKRKENLGLIIIDYLQLMTPEGRSGSREQEVSTISRALKELGMELQIPVIALSQLSREVEKSNREPMLSDLRESGSIEQDADMVMFLWSPTESEIQEDASMLQRRHIKIAKQRDGMLLKTTLEFKDVFQLFTEVDNGYRNATPPAGFRSVLPHEKDSPF